MEVKLYAALGGSSKVIFSDEVPVNVLTWLAIISPTLSPFITEPKTGIINYNLQRAMRQLRYDQSAIQITGRWVALTLLLLILNLLAKVKSIYRNFILFSG